MDSGVRSMSNYSKKIVYLSNEQCQELFTNQTIIVDGTTIAYNENDIYVTPQAEPITDVKINNVSIGNNGIATIPVASTNQLGVIMSDADYGTEVANNRIKIVKAADDQIKLGTHQSRPVTPYNQHIAAFYGLSKVAGVDLASVTCTLGIYPDASKAAIQNMLGITDLLSTEESSTATAAHAANSTFMMNGKLHRATAAIAIGDAVEVGTNCEVVKADEVFVKNTDIASLDTTGVVKINPDYGIGIFNGYLMLNQATTANIKAGSNSTKAVSAYRQHEAVFYGLSKVAGVDLANETITLGTYPETSKTAINNMLGTVSKDSLDNAGITARTYTTKFDGEFSVTTAVSQDYISPYARASVTGRISKEKMHRVTINGVQYILQTRLWYNPTSRDLKVYEYLGNLGLYISDISGVPGGTDNVPFVIISDLNNSNSIDVLTSTAGTYTLLVEQINNTQKRLPKSLIYGDSYAPIEKNNNGGTYNGFSLGVNELKNTRGTFALGYGNKTTGDFSIALGLKNEVKYGGYAIGDSNLAHGGYIIGLKNEASIDGVAIGRNNQATDSSIAIGSDLIATKGITAIGFSNVEVPGYPAWQTNTLYNIGDIITYSSLPTSFKCINTHTSSNSFSSDFATNWEVVATTRKTTSIFVIGNGDINTHSNALTIDYLGNGKFNGNIYVECNNDSTGGTMLPKDIQINNTSIVSNGIATIPIASNSTFGVVKTGGYGIRINNDGVLYVSPASISTEVKPGVSNYLPIVPSTQHAAVFYGLSKVAGVDLASETITLGTYPETSKTAIRNMLGATSSNVIAVQDEQPTDTDTKVWLPETEAQGIQVPTMEDMANYVQKTDIASSTNYGIVKATNYYGIDMITTGSDAGFMRVYKAPSDQIKAGVNNYRPIVPSTQHEGVFYGLAKAAGDTTQTASENAVGTYTNDAKAAIQTMLGVPGDVQVNGTSVVSNGVASIPIAILTNVQGEGQYGLVKINSSNGITISSDGCLSVSRADERQYKNANNNYLMVTPYGQHMAAFYGLAKAAGDTTQSASSNAVGTYTEEAKAAIWNMLGLDGSAFVKSDWELIREDTVTNATEADIEITVDGNGNAFELTDLALMFELPKNDQSASKGAYGQLFFYYDNETKWVVTENGAMSRSAGGASIGTWTLIENHDGLITATRSQQTSTTNNGTLGWRYHTSTEPSNGIFLSSTPLIFTRVKISVVTGTGHYKLYGKRKRTGLDSPVINVSGATPTITALPGHRYICGEVATLDIVVPQSGIIDVTFDSGSTPTVLTVTPPTGMTMRWIGDDPTALEADKHYEINIADGCNGMVVSWT